MEQRAHGFDVWEEPFYTLRVPKLVDLQADPFEGAPEEGIDYDHWRIDRVYMILPGVAYVAAWLKSLFRKQLLGELQLSL
jgi:arylsulfatase